MSAASALFMQEFSQQEKNDNERKQNRNIESLARKRGTSLSYTGRFLLFLSIIVDTGPSVTNLKVSNRAR